MKKQVSFVSEHFFPNESGSEISLRSFASSLSHDGFNVEIITTSIKGLPKVEYRDSLKIIRCLPKPFGPSVIQFFIRILWIPFLFYYAKKTQLLEGHLFNSAIVPFVIVSNLLRVSSSVVLPISDIVYFKKYRKIDFYSFKFFLKYSNIVLLKAQDINLVSDEFSVPNSKIVFIKNPIGRHKINVKSKFNFTNKLNIGYIGKLVKDKNPKMILEIAKKMNKINFHIKGYGQEYENLKILIKSYDLNNIRFRNNSSVEKFLSEMDIMLFPYLSEPAFSQSIMESMKSGAASIITDSDNMRKFVKHNKDAILINPSLLNEWVDIISELNDNREKIKFIGVNANKCIVDNHLPEKFKKKWIKYVWNSI